MMLTLRTLVVGMIVALAIAALAAAATWLSDARLLLDAPPDDRPVIADRDVYTAALSERAANLRAGFPPGGIPDPLTVREA